MYFAIRLTKRLLNGRVDCLTVSVKTSNFKATSRNVKL